MQPSNILKIKTLDENWYDKDGVLLHACFQILTDFIEEEMETGDWIDWQPSERHQFAKQEIDFLYEWWKNYQNLDKNLPNWEDEILENQMLKRLIDIRWAMWT